MNLWASNTPQKFWKCLPDPPVEVWDAAYKNAFPELGLPGEVADLDQMLALTLGEGQFGEGHWQLSRLKRLYYQLKKYIPKNAVTLLKVANSALNTRTFPLGWPVEDRYVRFLWQVIRDVMKSTNRDSIEFINFWPDAKRFSLVLTHDIESEFGLEHVREIADLEESLGFRSSFNFVPEKYPRDQELIKDLRERGFEIGIHGVLHDGKLFSSREEFLSRAVRINGYIKELNASGFRTPYTHRNPEWMQELDLEYDLSFFDTDPYEPMGGGGMSIWPYTIGKFLELPYTLVQDSTLFFTLEETTPNIWDQKVEFIRANHGMVLLNSHPDYLAEPGLKKIYTDFLLSLRDMDDCWHGLPRDAAAWWKRRENFDQSSISGDCSLSRLQLDGDQIVIKQNF